MYAANEDRMNESDLRLLNDDELVIAVLKDSECFSVLYERYIRPVYRMCYRAVGSVDVAEDLAARSFLTVFERLHHYRPQDEGSFRAWLFVVVRNTVRDHWRRHRRELPHAPRHARAQLQLRLLHRGCSDIGIVEHRRRERFAR